MNIRVLVGAVAGTLLVPSIGLADFIYTGVEVSFLDVEFDNGVVALDGDGYRFGGTYALNNQYFLVGEFEERSFDLGIDGSTREFGVGFHRPFGNTLDFIGTASFVQEEIKLVGVGVAIDEDGFALGGGIRARLSDDFEVDASLQYVDLDQSGSHTGFKLRGRYYFTDRFAFSLETEFDDDIDTLSLGFRAEF